MQTVTLTLSNILSHWHLQNNYTEFSCYMGYQLSKAAHFCWCKPSNEAGLTTSLNRVSDFHDSLCRDHMLPAKHEH